mgnify:CR=1 FL=1
MKHIEKNIKEGIKLHILDTPKFKTNIVAIFLTTKLEKETVTKNALISAILRRGTESLKNQEEISKKLEDLYGATFDCGVDKTGDNQVLKFYIESVNDEFLPQKEEGVLKPSIETLCEIVFNPLIENNGFKLQYLEEEKENMNQRIQGKADNKARYALERCIEEMYKNKPFGLYKFGNIEDLENINEKNLYEQYKKLINDCKIDIFISGNIDEEIVNVVEKNKSIINLNARQPIYNKENSKVTTKRGAGIEKAEVQQGKLVIGLDVNYTGEDVKFPISIYNVILGESATSKLFQNVREKASLAYTARSNYVRQKSNIFIRCGIEIENFDKALEIIKKQLEDMKNGDFTEEDLENAKKYMISGITSIQDEQDSEVTYYIGQELSEKFTTFEEYAKKIEDVSMQDVKDVANSIDINTIYFLRN